MGYKTIHKIDEHNAVALCFKNEENFSKAVMILLENAPDHEFLFPGDDTIIMDKEDKRFLPISELKYEEEEVVPSSEVSQEELAELRYKNLFKGGDSDATIH